MGRWLAGGVMSWLALGLVTTTGPRAVPQTAAAMGGRSVYVVAVRTRAPQEVFRRCLRPGAVRPMIPNLPPSPGLELVPRSGELLPGGVPDPELRSKVEREFLKQKRYALAASLNEADLVFVVQGTYTSVFRAKWDGLESDGKRQPPNTSGAGQVVPWNPRGTVASFGRPDDPTNVPTAFSAVVVPREVFQQDVAYGGALLRARLWEGIVENRDVDDRSAAPDELVRRFHRQDKRPPTGLLCADPQPRRAPPLDPERARATAPAVPHPPGEAGPPVRVPLFSSDVLVVTVPVMAVDGQQAHVADLDASEFRLFEDDVAQKIEGLVPADEPLNVAVLIDSSFSMRPHEPAVRAAASGFIDALRDGDRVMVVPFDSRAYLAADLTADRELAKQSLGAMRSLGLSTRLHDTLLATAERLDSVEGRKVIVLMTDGMDVESGLADAASVRAKIESSNIVVHAVQLDTSRDARDARARLTTVIPPGVKPDLVPDGFLDSSQIFARASSDLHDLTGASGGRHEAASSVEGIAGGLERIAVSLRREYLLYYYPSDQTRDGRYRRLRVEVTRPDVTIRARSGYRAPQRSRETSGQRQRPDEDSMRVPL